MGNSPESIPHRLAAGQKADVVIMVGYARDKLRDTQNQRAATGVVLAVTIDVTVGFTLLAALMAFCVDALIDVSLHNTVKHKLGEFTHKVFAAELHQGVTECHIVVRHRLTPF